MPFWVTTKDVVEVERVGITNAHVRKMCTHTRIDIGVHEYLHVVVGNHASIAIEPVVVNKHDFEVFVDAHDIGSVVVVERLGVEVVGFSG